MSSVMLTLLVLKTARLEELCYFYHAVGMELSTEQHGSGPRHYSVRLGELVLELYPLPSGAAAERSDLRLGFAVGDLHATLLRLRRIGTDVRSQPTDTEWGLRAVVSDPDGRSVELYQTEGQRRRRGSDPAP
ncbi:MAG: VOC family protein [Armatimonadota bacterium]